MWKLNISQVLGPSLISDLYFRETEAKAQIIKSGYRGIRLGWENIAWIGVRGFYSEFYSLLYCHGSPLHTFVILIYKNEPNFFQHALYPHVMQGSKNVDC